MTLTLDNPASPIRGLPRLLQDEPRFATLGLLLAAALVPLALAGQIDPRQFQGESVWTKPAKFALALSIYTLTLAAFARFLPAGMTARRPWRLFSAAVVLAILAEMAWIGGAAAFGTASHFNRSSPAMEQIYNLMGGLAVLLTSASLVMGLAIRRSAATGLAPATHLGLWLGLVMTLPLTMIVAFTMAAGTGHHVGTPLTGAALPLMGWSREVGDLRIAHFLATHSLHAIPLAGLAAAALPVTVGRRAVWAAAALWAALVAATFAQALLGQPLLPA